MLHSNVSVFGECLINTLIPKEDLLCLWSESKNCLLMGALNVSARQRKILPDFITEDYSLQMQKGTLYDSKLK